ncbi:MAG: PilZ domain-containing protein [Pseudomonadota bacterium]
MVSFRINLSESHYQALKSVSLQRALSIDEIIQEALEQAGILALEEAVPSPSESVGEKQREASVPITEIELNAQEDVLSAALSVVNSHSQSVLGWLGDISKDGLMVVGDEPMPLNQSLNIAVELPGDNDAVVRSINLQVEAVWARPDESDVEMIQNGCAILQCVPEELALLLNHVKQQDVPQEGVRGSRKFLMFYLDIVERHSGELLGSLGDISTSGLMILAEQPLDLNQVIDARIKLLDIDEFTKKHIDVTLETRWTRPDSNPDWHCIGCRFINIAEEDKPLIGQVQEVLGFHDVGLE